MTLPRTIHRREARKRAKARRSSGNSGRGFVFPQWLIEERLKEMRARLMLADAFNRTYDSHFKKT
jgi:hypothetical protein